MSSRITRVNLVSAAASTAALSNLPSESFLAVEFPSEVVLFVRSRMEGSRRSKLAHSRTRN